MATNDLRQKLQNRTLAGRHGDLAAMTRFSDAAALWLTKVDEMVSEGRRSPGTVDTYRRQLKNHVLPGWGKYGSRRPPHPSSTRWSAQSRRTSAQQPPRAVGASSRE
jgi:hypothetical protein